jgi:hypothetical protein
MNNRLGPVGTTYTPCLTVANPDNPSFGGYLTRGGSLVMGWRGTQSDRLWGSVFPWSTDHELGPTELGSWPAMAANWTSPNGPSLLCAWLDAKTNQVMTATAFLSGGTLSLGAPSPVIGALTDLAPAACGNLSNSYVFWKGDAAPGTEPARNRLWYSLDGNGPAQMVPDAAPDTTPAAAAGPALDGYDSLSMYLVWADVEGALWTTSSVDGSTWQGVQPGPSAYCVQGPAAAYFAGRLVVAWTTPESGQIVLSSLGDQDGTWMSVTALPDALSHQGPALAVWNNRLYVAWAGQSDGNAWYTTLTAAQVQQIPSERPVRVAITNTVAGGHFTAPVKLGGDASEGGATANLMVDSGSSTLVVGPAFVPSGGYSTTTYAGQLQYGDGHVIASVAGPIVGTRVSVSSGSGGNSGIPDPPADRYAASVTLADANVLLAGLQGQSDSAFSGGDGIVGLAYSSLDWAFDLRAYFQAKNLPATTYPWPSQLDNANFGSLPHIAALYLDPYFTQLEQTGMTPDRFGVWVHRSQISQRTDPPSENPANWGYLVLGGGEDSTELYLGDFSEIAIVDDTTYSVQLLSVQVGDIVLTGVSDANWSWGQPGNALFDTGTSTILAAPSIYSQLLDAFVAVSPAIAPYIATIGEGLSGPIMDLGWPDIVFTFADLNGQPVSIVCNPYQYWQKDAPIAGSWKFMIWEGPETGPSVLGMTAMTAYYTVFDRLAGGYGAIRMAEKICYVS